MVEASFVVENDFLKDVGALRDSARAALDTDRPDTGRSAAPQAIALLQTALAIEMVCVWRYTMISVSVAGFANPNVGAEFQEQANDERRHMRLLAERITELGGTPDFSPAGLMSQRSMEYGSGDDLGAMIARNLAAEEAAIAHYRDLIPWFETTDPETSRMLETIMQDEEDHAVDMQDLLSARV